MPVANLLIASSLQEIADRLEIQGANAFRVCAYRNAARTIEELADDIRQMVERGETLADYPGIGTDSPARSPKSRNAEHAICCNRFDTKCRPPSRSSSRVLRRRILQIVRKAKSKSIYLELNAQPERLDPIDTYCRMCKDEGLRVAINSDAHSTRELANLRFGVGQARRGWLERDAPIAISL